MVGGEGEHDVFDVVLLENPCELIGSSEHRYVGQFLVQGQGIGIDESDEVEPVVLLAHDFPRDLLSDQAGPDDDGILLERRSAPEHRAHHASVDRDGHDRDHPEGGHVAAVQVAHGGELRQHEHQPGRHGDAVEDRPNLVQGCVVGADAVAPVEAIEPRQHRPQWQNQEQRRELRRVLDPE